MKTIHIVTDFSEFPGLRNCDISENSGEEFYHRILNPAFAKAWQDRSKLLINLDNTAGYASSFLDEAFGNLVYDFSLAVVQGGVEIVSNDEPHWKKMIADQTYKEWERRRKNGEKPKVTKVHEAWHRLVDAELICKVWERPAV